MPEVLIVVVVVCTSLRDFALSVLLQNYVHRISLFLGCAVLHTVTKLSRAGHN